MLCVVGVEWGVFWGIWVGKSGVVGCIDKFLLIYG